jgi:uncharacterized iron-regulated membrane protein
LILGISGSVLMLVPDREQDSGAEVSITAESVGPSYDALAGVINRRGTITAVRLPLASGDVVTWRIAVKGDRPRIVRTDPQTGREIPPVQAGWGSRLWWHQLHGSLLSGATGRLVVGWLGLGLGTLCVTGLILWWPGAGKLSQTLLLRRNRSIGAWQLHHVLGVWLALPLALLAITGSYFAFPTQYAALAGAAPSGRPPTVTHRDPGTGPLPRAPIAALIESSRKALPDGRPSMIQWMPSGLVDVTVYRVGDWWPRGNNVVHVRADTAAMVAVDRFENAAFGTRLVAAMRPVHVGAVGGRLLWAVWLIAGLVPPLLFITGLLMWWRRSLRLWLTIRDGVTVSPDTSPSS